jgi:hypothetical protein
MVVSGTIEYPMIVATILATLYVYMYVYFGCCKKCTDLGGAKELRWGVQGSGDG